MACLKGTVVKLEEEVEKCAEEPNGNLEAVWLNSATEAGKATALTATFEAF